MWLICDAVTRSVRVMKIRTNARVPHVFRTPTSSIRIDVRKRRFNIVNFFIELIPRICVRLSVKEDRISDVPVIAVHIAVSGRSFPNYLVLEKQRPEDSIEHELQKMTRSRIAMEIKLPVSFSTRCSSTKRGAIIARYAIIGECLRKLWSASTSSTTATFGQLSMNA